MLVVLGAFEPDKSKYNAGVTSVAVNCLPVADGWGPMPTLTTFTTALSSPPRGLILVRTSTGGYQVYAGETTKLDKLDTGVVPNAWTDVTRSVGGAYAVPPGDSWSFARYGSRLVAANVTNELQFIDVDSGTLFANLPGSPPQARFVFVAGDFLATGYNSSLPNRVRWSAFNNSEEWTLQTRGAGLQDILSGNEVQGGIGSDQGAIIFQRNQIVAMLKVVNVSAAFDFSNVLNPYRGTIAPYGIATANTGQIFYPCEDGFYQGVEGTPIGAEKVDRWFFNEEVDRDYLQEIRASVDPYNKIVWFNYRKIGGVSALLGYAWQLDRWCYSDQNVSYISAIATAGITWDGLDNLYATIDDVDEAFDSRLFAGGRPTLAAFDADYKLGTFTGPNAAVTIETADVQLVTDRRAFLKSARLVGDCSDFTMSVGTSEIAGGPVAWHGPFSPQAIGNKVYFSDSRLAASGGVSGLFHRFRVNIPAGATWKVVSAIVSDETPEGSR